VTALPRRDEPLSSEEVLELGGADLTTATGRGRVIARARFDTPPNCPERRLAEALAAAAPQPTEEERRELQRRLDSTSFAGTSNPARVVEAPASVERLPLSPADIAWLDRLPKEPTEISAEYLRIVAAMAGRAASDGDRRLLETILGPVRAHHDRLERRSQLEDTIAKASRSHQRSRDVEQLAISVLAERLHQETPELTEGEAEARARQALRERWDRAEGQRQEKLRIAKEQLAELDKGAR
jgi:hypothetical protein